MLSGSVALVIALLSSLGWAAFDASRKGLVRHASPASLVVMFGAGQLPCFLLGMGIWGAPTLDLGYLRPGLTCLAANVAANLMFFHAVKVSPISRTVPLLALTPVFAALIGYLLLDEHPSPRQWFGIALIVLGAWTLNAGQGLKGLVLGVLKERGSVYMALVAGAWAVSATNDKLALPHANVAFHASVQTGGVMLVALFWLLVSGRARELGEARKHWPAVGAGVVVSVAALGLQLIAIQTLLVSLMEAIKRALGVVGSVISGRLLFKEAVTRSMLVACALLSLGVFLLM
ncbi:MAG: EamA family transporter [Polyangiaceae bacterium]|nr:EamA family transporter [Myxococcales bacterium]MCB9585638.1 EamA family transporter [Polyangiaceae bacterium]